MITKPIYRTKLLLFFLFLILIIFNFCLYFYSNTNNITASNEEQDETIFQLIKLKDDSATSRDIKDKCESLIAEIQEIKPKISTQLEKFLSSIITSSLEDPMYTNVLTLIGHNCNLPDLNSNDKKKLVTMSQLVKDMIDTNVNITDLLISISKSTQIKELIELYGRLKVFLDKMQKSFDILKDSNQQLSQTALKVPTEKLDTLEAAINYANKESAPAEYHNVIVLESEFFQKMRIELEKVLFTSHSTNPTNNSQLSSKWWWFLLIIIFFIFLICGLASFIHYNKKKSPLNHHHQ